MMNSKSPGQGTEEERSNVGASRRRIGLVLGPATFVLVLLLPAPGGMGFEAWRTVAVGLLMAIWWITEAIPIPATSLLPLALFPLLDVGSIDAAATPYANPIIFLFLGGFMIAQAMQRWNLHRRIALRIILTLGTEPVRLILGFMIAAAFLSMWVSNTATAVMMLPIGLSVVDLVIKREHGADLDPASSSFAVALMLGIAYACSVGGLGTLIGTPPNALLAGYLADTYEIDIGFGQWMLVGMPFVVIGVPAVWLVLTRWIYRVRIERIKGGDEAIRSEMSRLGAMSRGERLAGIVFVGAATLWITRPLLEEVLPGLSDAGIAIIAAIALFLLPVDLRRGEFVLNWEWARRLPWDVLILFAEGFHSQRL
jgi:solute carrier family 13 (sodium-dependent dicarboxylate transporter), member 2/3/5